MIPNNIFAQRFANPVMGQPGILQNIGGMRPGMPPGGQMGGPVMQPGQNMWNMNGGYPPARSPLMGEPGTNYLAFRGMAY